MAVIFDILGFCLIWHECPCVVCRGVACQNSKLIFGNFKTKHFAVIKFLLHPKLIFFALPQISQTTPYLIS